MAIEVTPLTYADAMKLESEMFVMNNSAGANVRPRGIIHLSMKDGDREIAIEIGSTWLPIDLLTFASITALRGSTNLRDLLRERHLVAITAEQAKRILTSPSARAEADRYSEVLASLPGATKATIGSNTVSIQTGGGSAVVNMPPVAKNADQPSAQFADLVSRFNEGHVDDAVAAATIREMYKTGAVSIMQLQMGVSSVRNTSSAFYRAVEALISDPAGAESTTGSDDSVGPTVTF